jgi:hypothetical protein
MNAAMIFSRGVAPAGAAGLAVRRVFLAVVFRAMAISLWVFRHFALRQCIASEAANPRR